MKKSIFTLVLALCTSVLGAVSYTDVVITPSENTIVSHYAGIGAKLPADFNSTIFDGSGNPLMDRLYIFMTMPTGMASYTITSPNIECYMDGSELKARFPQATLTAGNDYLLQYTKSGSRYVMSSLPFDPATRALDPITIGEGNIEKVYVTGKVNNKLSAQLPENIKIAMPPYLESTRQMLCDMIAEQVHTSIEGMGLSTFSFESNTEGFFYFTGDESSKLELYLEDLEMAVKDKENDFIGGVVGSQVEINLMGIDTPDDDAVEWAAGITSNDLETMDITSLKEQKIRALTGTQILSIATRLTQEQCGWIAPGQICQMLGQTDIAYVMGMADIGTQLYNIFDDADKATTVGNTISGLQSRIVSEISSQLDMSSLSSSLLSGGFDKLFSALVQGTASPFAFASESEYLENRAFNINVHSKGVNTITGGAQAEFKNVGPEMSALVSGMSSSSEVVTMITDLGTIFEAMIKFTSAPFAIRPSAKSVDKGDDSEYAYKCARFNFNDIWVDGTTRTNGLLQMPVEGDELGAPSIDIGTPNGQVIFNGGRYKFHTPVSNKRKNMFYVATMAICYRELAVTMPIVNKDITYAGVGTSVGWGPGKNREDWFRNVIINDGTFSTYSSELWTDPSRGDNAVDAVGNGWYEHYTDLRLPYNTSILGGTFPDETYVRRCDAAAEQGVKPVFIYIEDPSDPTSPQWITPLCERKELVANVDLADPADPTKTNGTVKVTNQNKQMLTVKSGASSTISQEYGTESITADANGKVFVYVTGTCTVDRNYVRNYVTALAPFGEKHMSTEMMKMGGNVEVKSLYQDNADFPLKNAYLLYTQLGYYTYINAGVNIGKFRTLQDEFQIDRAQHHNFKQTGSAKNASGQNIMTTTDKTGVIFSEITNNDSYTIENGLYMMLPAMSDQWMMISSPFDVANIYLLETTETPSFETIKGWKEAGTYDTNFEEFFTTQGAADGDMAQTLVTSVLPDIFSGRGSGIKKPLPYILNNLTNDATKLTKLTHYNGKNKLSESNFYLKLYIPDEKGTHCSLQKETTNSLEYKWADAPASTTPEYITDFIDDPDCTDWYDCDQIKVTRYYVDENDEQRPAEEQRVIMKRDSVYSLYFPDAGRQFYNYKYLIFEGYGPQQISGKAVHSGFANPEPSHAAYPGEGNIALQGNTTFGNLSINTTDANPIFLTEKEQKGGSLINPDGSINYNAKIEYTFKKTAAGTQRILPASVYMVSGNGKAAKETTVMPLRKYTTETDNIPTFADEAVRVWTDNGIYISAIISQHISVYTLDGRTLWSGEVSEGTTQFVPADRGMYVVQGETTAVKVVN